MPPAPPFWLRQGASQEPHSFDVLMPQYLDWLRVRAYAAATVENRYKTLRRFVLWCEPRAVTSPGDVTQELLEGFQRYLYHYRNERSERPLALETQRRMLGELRCFFRWTRKQGFILTDPALDMELPKLPQRLPRHILSAEETERVLMQPDLTTKIGSRDRAMLETLYSTGMRRTELTKLSLYDVDVPKGTVMIRQGKGKKDRLIPISERACYWIERYVHQVRPYLSRHDDDTTIFLNRGGRPLSGSHLSAITKSYIKKAHIDKEGACHLFRHTMATLMLDNGADTRYIQEMLGHAKLSTTQIYTKVSIKKLKEIHTKTHPAARLEGRREWDEPVEEMPPRPYLVPEL